MNFWGTPKREMRPLRLYIEIGDPTDDTILTSMLMVDCYSMACEREKHKADTFAWWSSRAASSL